MADTTEDILKSILTELQQQRADLNKSFQNQNKPKSNRPSGGGGGGGGDIDLTRNFNALAGSTSGLTGAMISGASSISGMTGKVLELGGSFSNLTGKIPGLNTVFGMLGDTVTGSVAYLEANITAYRSLSKVGLGLAGDVGKLGQLAGHANVALGPFTELIAQNKDLLLGFSDGLDGGAKNLSAMLKEFSEGTGNFQRDIMSLGFTLDESNELFTRNLLIQRRTNLLTGKSQADAALAAKNLATEMSTLSKLTGEDVKSIQDKILAEQMSGDNALMIRQMEAQGFAEAGNAHADIVKQLGMLGPEYVQMFKEYAQYGTLMSDQSKDFANQNKEAADMIFGSAMAFRGHNADEAKRMTKEATALTLEYQRSVEFMQMGQQAMLGGPYEAAKKSFENTQQIQRRIDAVLAEDPSMTVSQAIAKIMNDAAKATSTQIDEGQKDSALGTVNAIEREAAQALGVLNKTASSIISDSENLVATVRGLAEEAIKILKDSANFALEVVSETNQELVNDIKDQKGKSLQVGGKSVTITEELIQKLDKFVDPTTGNKEKESLQKELQGLGLVTEQGNINTSKQALTGSMIDVIQELKLSNAFGTDPEITKQIFQDLENYKQGTVAEIQKNYKGIYQLYEKFFIEQRQQEEKWAKAEQQVINEGPKLGFAGTGLMYEPPQQVLPDTNTKTSESEREKNNDKKDDSLSNLSVKISESMVNAEVDGMIQLTIPADQITLSSVSGGKGTETAQFMQVDMKQDIGPIQETFRNQEMLLGAIAKNTGKIEVTNLNKPYTEPRNKPTEDSQNIVNTELLGLLKQANINLVKLDETLHKDNIAMITKVESLIGINTYGNTQRDTNLRYMRDIVS